MATTTTITTTYAGEKLRGYIATALLSANSISNGGVSVKANVKYKDVIKQMALGTDLIKEGSCDFDATSSVDLTERYLEPEEFQVNMQLCKQDFRDDWEAISMGYSAWDNLPPDFETYFVARIIARVATANERIIWQGADAVAGEYAGFLELFAADADVVKLVGTAITATNVVDELGRVVDAILPQLYGNPDLSIYIPQNVYRAYVRALGGFQSGGQGAAGFQDRGNNQTFGDLVFDGVRLLVCNGLPDNTIVAAESSNLWFGTGLFNDQNMLKVKDMEDVDLSQNVRFAMRWTATVNYGIGSEVITYVPV